MTAESVVQAARSLLFVPGDRPDRFAKAVASGADLVILDLEDAVSPSAKDLARAEVAAFLTAGHRCAVRINGSDSEWHEADVAALARAGAPLMVPKAHARVIEPLLRRLAAPVPLLALVETAEGVLEVAELARVPGVTRLAFGSVDLGAELGVSPDDREAMATARGHLVLASAAAGLPGPVDGVTVAVADDAAAGEDARYARRLGFGGKLCIHPRQVAAVRAAFEPSVQEQQWAARVVAASRASAGGVLTLDGRMVDKPVVDRAIEDPGGSDPARDAGGPSMTEQVPGASRVTYPSVAPALVGGLAALFDGLPTPQAGEPLPPLWHWVGLAAWAPAGQTGADGHPMTGDFLPDVGKPRRMFAGGSVRFDGPLARRGARDARGAGPLRGAEAAGGRATSSSSASRRPLQTSAGTSPCARPRTWSIAMPQSPRGAKPPGPPRAPTRAPGRPARRPVAAAPGRRGLGDAHRPDQAHAVQRRHRQWPPDPLRPGLCHRRRGVPGLVVHGPLITLSLLEVLRLEGLPPVRSMTHRGLRPLFCGTEARIRLTRPEPARAQLALVTDAGEHAVVAVEFASEEGPGPGQPHAGRARAGADEATRLCPGAAERACAGREPGGIRARGGASPTGRLRRLSPGHRGGLAPRRAQPEESRTRGTSRPPMPKEKEGREAGMWPVQPLEVLAEEPGDEGQREEHRREDRQPLHGGALPDRTSVCSTEMTAMLASRTVASRSRCAETSSLTSSRWSWTSRR